MGRVKIFLLITIFLLALINLHSELIVRTTAELVSAVNTANSGGDNEIVLMDGDYILNNMLWISADNVTIRSFSGNRNAVTVSGQGMRGGVSHIFNVAGTNFTVRDMTIGWVANHAIQIHGNNNSSNTVISNLHIIDTFEQMVKISYDSTNSNSSNNGLMENCLLEYSAGIGPQWYIGGIDGHRCINWVVRNNTFKNIISPESDLAEHAIHFWSNSSGTLVENNIIINCDRGIGFGLGDRGHIGGIIRNNFIYHNALNQSTADVGIGLENASGAMVYNNTIYFENSYPNAIEYRFPGTNGGFISNNLTNRLIRDRDGGTATVQNNITNSVSSWFVNVSIGDLHLASGISSVIDSGIVISGLTDDIDGDSRPQGAGIDIGADEYRVSLGEITVLSPNGGESLVLNSNYNISWESSGLTNNIKITLWQDGSFIRVLGDNVDPSLGSYSWTATDPIGSGYTVKIKEKGTSVSDFSNSSFSIISAPSIRVLSPNGGENLVLNSTYNISWESSNLSNNIKITLWQDGSLLNVLATNIDPSLGSYNWTVTDSIGSGYTVKIKEKGTSVSDFSDSSFSIIPAPSIRVLSPNGGESLVLNSTYNISWESLGLTNNIKITLWQEGSFVRVLADNIDPSLGSYSWTVTDPIGTGYTVKIKEKGTAVSDFSDSSFSIISAPLIRVLSPNGGESLVLNSNHNISWESSGLSNNIKITLWQDGSLLRVLANNIDPSLGSYNWTVSDPIGSGYTVKIKEKGTAVSDFSDNEFTIFAGSTNALIQPQNFEYIGAFRLPEGTSDIKTWAWGGYAMTYYPGGDSSGPNDGFPGSIFGAGHAWEHQVSEISIPIPVISSTKNLSDLNTARTLQPFTDILTVSDLEIPRTGLVYLSKQGTQSSDKLYFCTGHHMEEGDTGISHGWSELNLDNPQIKGNWRIGGYLNYLTNDYMFEIPKTWADDNISGMYIATGRYRDGGQGAQGPSIFAIAPWNSGNPPPTDSTLTAVPLLLYEDVTENNPNSLNNYHHSDEWSGAAWIRKGGRSAVIFAGTKGIGECWYGCADGRVWEPPYPEPCAERGWWSTAFEGQILFFNPSDLELVANGTINSYEPQPYAVLNIDPYLFNINSSQQKNHIGAICFDSVSGLLYVFEPLVDNDKPIIHVWRIN